MLLWTLMALCINILLNCNVYLPCTIRGWGVRAIIWHVCCNSIFWHWMECGSNFQMEKKIAPKQTSELEYMLQELSAALLKPLQWLELLRTFLVPKLVHSLVLGVRLVCVQLSVPGSASQKILRWPLCMPISILGGWTYMPIHIYSSFAKVQDYKAAKQ